MEIPILLCLFVAAVGRIIPFDASLDANWEKFKKIYGKDYKAREDGARRLLWEQSVVAVRDHNLQADLGLHSYKRSINKYADLGQQEIVRTLNGFRRNYNLRGNGSSWIPPSHIQLPESVDWRKEALVTDVKDQKQCGSCWAFSATGSLEGQHKRKTGQLVSLSEQNLIDCSRGIEGNNGCDGGLMDEAFEYVKRNNGIDKEESYPYAALDGTCHFKRIEVGATCSGFVDIPAGDEKALQEAVATVGPISVAIDASHPGFHSYGSGIYDEPLCDPEKLDHGVLLVGYGSENGKDYWLVKNSWGTSWGIGGYIKMARNKKNQCGIATMASYPLV